MGILALGLSYRRAPIDLLERFAFDDDGLTKAYRRAADHDGVAEAVVLSTCNRVEVYAVVESYHAGFAELKRLLAGSADLDLEALADPLYAHWDRDAAEHLFSVAAGLDSMVLGETQIHAQVREAIRRAGGEHAAGPVLTALFHAAARTGRRVRAETSLGAAPDAFVARGADRAAAALGGLRGRTAVIVGAGRMAALAAGHLRDAGVASVRILNRSRSHADALAARLGAEAGDLASLPDAIGAADVIVSATGAAGYLLTRAEAEPATAARAGRPLVLLDLAVPRDVEPTCADVPGVTVIDVDALRSGDDQSGPAAAAIAEATAIVAEEVRRWEVRRRGDELAPLIRALHERGDAVVRAELGRWAARLEGLSPAEREAVEAVARGVAAKLLHDPIVELKERSEPGTERAHARLLAELLAIELDDPA